MRVLGYLGSAVTLVAILALGVSSLRSSGSAGDEVAAATVGDTVTAAEHPVEQSGSAVTTPAAAAPLPTTPSVPLGRTALGEGFTVDRRADTVVVTFDTREARTRRSDKFERVVRATLPIVLGDAGRAAMTALQPGALVPAGELLDAVGTRPIRLPAGEGRVITIAPRTRRGEDGPLVVSYEAVIMVVTPAPAS